MSRSYLIVSSQDATSTSKSPEDWIRLVSDDGYSYLVKRKVAMASGTLRNMLGVESRFYLWYVRGTLTNPALMRQAASRNLHSTHVLSTHGQCMCLSQN